MYKDLDYRPESYASAVNYANRLNSEMESAKSECLGILSGLNPPADLDISGEVSSLKSIIESMSTRVGEIRTTIEEIRNEIESRDSEIASQLEAYINNEKAYVHNTEIERIAGSKPDPKDYADGVNDEAYIKDLEKYELTVAAYEAFSEGKTDYNYLKSTYGEAIATKIQLEYGKQYGSTVGEGKSIVEGVKDIATGVKDAAVLYVTDPVEFYKRAGATITNTGAAIIKGGLDLVEGVMDFGAAIGGAVGAGVAKWTGNEETSKTISEKTSSFISTDWVDKGYDYIYNTAGGQWLDSKSLLTHDSEAFDTIAGFGKMAGLILISTVASPAVGALVAGASAGGETIEKDFQNLGGSTSDLGEYGQTLLHGTLTGAVEGAMWYGGSKVNLGGDLALSVVDPVARTGVQMISPTENRSFKEIFNEDYGGAKGIITNMAFSILGNKLSDGFSATKNVDIENNTKMKPDIGVETNTPEFYNLRDTTWGKERAGVLDDLIDEWDNDANKIPYKLGKQLEDVINDDTKVLAIHRTGLSLDESTDIFEHGLINNGAALQGVFQEGPPSLSKTVLPISNPLDLDMALKRNYTSPSSFTSSKGAVIVELPKSVVDDFGEIIPGKEMEVYDLINGVYHIKPKYISGYVSMEDNIRKFYPKSEITKLIV